MNILNVLKPSYYFDSFVNPDFKLLWPLVVVLTVVLLLTIIFNIRTKSLQREWSGIKKFWWTHWSNMAYTVSIVGLVHLFLRYQNIPYINWRFWPLLMILGVFSWLGYLLYYRKVIQPQKQADKELRKGVAYYFRRRRKK
ncbi:hypothetical protein KJ836_01655 [Patescibacteria group bacterium]|nr:hypothetical protein [Patescibacteria group bacterium]